ncbi:MAG: ABC transporter permease [Candidatus Eremiobacteraeota bacterium]|nr:ABC transporter permease [Candidatus Eremiobacteraeota bacterium]
MVQTEVKAALAETVAAERSRQSRAYWIRFALAIAGLILIVIAVNVFTHGYFLGPRNLITVLRQITYNAILGVGQTFVIITAGIDLSIGSLVSLTGVVMAILANALHLSGFSLIAVTLVGGIFVGALAGYINALPVVKLNLPPFITTLAMMLMARGLSYKISHGRPVGLNSDAFSNIGIGYIVNTIPISVIWMALIVFVFSVLLTRMRFGRYVFAIGGNEEASRLAGINVARIKTLVYVISGVCAAVTGFLLMSRFSSGSPQTGTGYELQAIAAVVVGGTSLMGGRGSIVGTFFGALLIGILNNVMNLMGIESYTQEIVLGAVILVAVILDELRKRYLRRT